MPRIFDNIELKLLPDLQKAIQASYRTDFCVGYLTLRGWKRICQGCIEPPIADRYLRTPTGFTGRQPADG